MTAEMMQISDRLDRIERATLLAAKPVIGIEEAALFTGYTVRGLYEMTSKKLIPHYKRGNRVFFKKDELVDWMTATKVKTEAELQSMADTYTATRRGWSR